ncbi:hypothetical protein LSM04_002878 [Trypanosoma melophagium]|uniref:uncharacterized protein n=1 Tax=Trypanosoma melophagium TaxID=715481 RepID=UPI00351A3D5C|nr:hypothetical protein LSM04_002878 [Trypanosoma melophagium]
MLSSYCGDGVDGGFRVRVQQGTHFCPVIHVEKETANGRNEGLHVLLENGPFSLRVESGGQEAVVVIEVDGIVFAGEHRLPPHGARTVHRLHEHNTATTRPLTYRKPARQKTQRRAHSALFAKEAELPVEEEGHTSLFRVFFLPVLGGVQATRSGKWRIANNAPPLAVIMFRFGNANELAKAFGISKEELANMRVSAGDTSTPTRARTPTPTSRSESIPTNMLYTLYRRSSSTNSNSYSSSRNCFSRSVSMDSGTPAPHPSSSLTSFLQTSIARTGKASTAPLIAPPMIPKRRPTIRSNSEMDLAHGRPESKSWSVLTPQPEKQMEENMLRIPRRSVSSEAHAMIRSVSNRESSISNRERSNSNTEVRSNSLVHERGPSWNSSHGSNGRYRICVRCNVSFDRERREYMDMIADLANQVQILKQENSELELKYRDATLSIPESGVQHRIQYKEEQEQQQQQQQKQKRKQHQELDCLDRTLNPAQSVLNQTNIIPPFRYEMRITPSMDVSYHSATSTEN